MKPLIHRRATRTTATRTGRSRSAASARRSDAARSTRGTAGRPSGGRPGRGRRPTGSTRWTRPPTPMRRGARGRAGSTRPTITEWCGKERPLYGKWLIPDPLQRLSSSVVGLLTSLPPEAQISRQNEVWYQFGIFPLAIAKQPSAMFFLGRKNELIVHPKIHAKMSRSPSTLSVFFGTLFRHFHACLTVSLSQTPRRVLVVQHGCSDQPVIVTAPAIL